MRKIGSSRGMVSAYPRQLESLIRLAEAHAKVRFSDKVEAIDVEEAKRLHREALKQSATDPRTGIVDISILTTGLLLALNKKTYSGIVLLIKVHFKGEQGMYICSPLVPAKQKAQARRSLELRSSRQTEAGQQDSVSK